jgi:mRNA interferase YafQ
MLAFRTTGRFEKEFRLAVKRRKDVSRLKAVMRALVREVPLAPRLRDHALKGEFAGRRECHVETDLLTAPSRCPVRKGEAISNPYFRLADGQD